MCHVLNVDRIDRYTERLCKVLNRANELSMEHNNNWIGFEHVIAAMIEEFGSIENFLSKYPFPLSDHRVSSGEYLLQSMSTDCQDSLS